MAEFEIRRTTHLELAAVLQRLHLRAKRPVRLRRLVRRRVRVQTRVPFEYAILERIRLAPRDLVVHQSRLVRPAPIGAPRPRRHQLFRRRLRLEFELDVEPVSYTHLTLPTKA